MNWNLLEKPENNVQNANRMRLKRQSQRHFTPFEITSIGYLSCMSTFEEIEKSISLVRIQGEGSATCAKVTLSRGLEAQ
jgi:hypothetical protein